MLTRSPTCVPARSPSASPSSFHTTRAASFHYAPASPQKRSPKPTAVSRRQSTSSPLGMNKPTTSSSQLPLQQPPTPPARKQAPLDRATSPSTTATTAYVAIDAATQYSPMEPHDYFAPPTAPTSRSSPTANAPSSSSSSSLLPTAPPAQGTVSRQPSQTIHRTQQPTTDGEPASSATAPVANPSTPTLVENPPMLKAPHPLSPTKRRNSQGPGSVIGEASSGVAQGLPKRAKPETAPPKVLPVRYELCAIDDIVVLIANMLSELIETNDALAMRSGCLTRFHSRTAPGISVLDYLHRLAKHATLIPPLLLSMVYYIDRLCALYPDFTINTLTVHRFLITAATVAAKGLSDSFWNNSTYARVGGVRVAELKLLELEFLHRVDWKIVPDPDVLVAYYRGLVQRSPAYVLEDEVDDDDDNDEEEDGETELSDDMDEDEDEEEEEEAMAGRASTSGTRSGTAAQGKPPEATAVPPTAAA